MQHFFLHCSPGFHGLPKRSGTLKDITKFDAAFFGVHPKQANAMDPQLRMLLEVAYEALVDAGWVKKKNKQRIAVHQFPVGFLLRMLRCPRCLFVRSQSPVGTWQQDRSVHRLQSFRVSWCLVHQHGRSGGLRNDWMFTFNVCQQTVLLLWLQRYVCIAVFLMSKTCTLNFAQQHQDCVTRFQACRLFFFFLNQLFV